MESSSKRMRMDNKSNGFVRNYGAKRRQLNPESPLGSKSKSSEVTPHVYIFDSGGYTIKTGNASLREPV